MIKDLFKSFLIILLLGFTTGAVATQAKQIIIEGNYIADGEEVMFGAPTNKTRYERSILPETDSKYYLGSTNKAWLQATSDSFCLTGDSCITEWASGGGGGAGFWATSTDNLLIRPTPSSYIVVVGGTATTSPWNGESLQVIGGILTDDILTTNATTTSFGIGGETFTSLTGTNLSVTNGVLNASGGSMTALPQGNLYVGNVSNEASATSTLYLDSNGNFGIGSTSPTEKLTVTGNLYLTGNITKGTWNGSVIDSAYIQDAYVKKTGDSMTGNLEITTALNPQLSIKATGIAQQAHLYLEDSDTGTAWQIGAMTNGRLRFVRGDTVQTYFTTTGGAVMNVNQNDADFQMNWDSGVSFFSEGGNGYIGIATTTPAYQLDVYGNTRIDGTLNVTGQTTLANASTTNLTVITNSNLGTVQTGTWNGTAIDFSSYTNATAGTGITFTDDAISTNDSQIVHDNLSGFVANEHIDWTTDQGATNIDAGNYTDTNTTYTAGGTLLDLTGTTFSLNEGTLTNGKLCTFVTGTGLVCNTTDNSTNWDTAYGWGDWNGNIDISTDTNLGAETDSNLAITSDNIDVASGYEIPTTASTTLWDIDDPTFFASSSLIYFAGATTTIPLGQSIQDELWQTAYCYTTAGTADIRCGNGTTWSNLYHLTTATSSSAFNYRFNSTNKRQCEIGAVSSSNTGVSCTIKQIWQ